MRARMRSPWPSAASPPACRPRAAEHQGARALAFRGVPHGGLGDQLAVVVAGDDLEHGDGRQVPALLEALAVAGEQACRRPSRASSALRAMRSPPLMPKARAISRLPDLGGRGAQKVENLVACWAGLARCGLLVSVCGARARDVRTPPLPWSRRAWASSAWPTSARPWPWRPRPAFAGLRRRHSSLALSWRGGLWASTGPWRRARRSAARPRPWSAPPGPWRAAAWR